ncbi:MAG: TIGR03936 family radical SAM-associated protein [Acidimicrobiales bacterium]
MSGRARLRVRFSKVGKIRWTSHRDVARMWERAFRRAQLPLAYSEGFSPRPRVSFGLALPTGHESVAEYLDVELAGSGGFDVYTLPDRLSEALPAGVDAMAAGLIGSGEPSLQEDVFSCTWSLLAVAQEGTDPPGEGALATRVAAVLQAPSVVVARSRNGVETADDIRAGILDLQLVGPAGPDPSDGMWLEASLACRPRSIRPSEVLAALGPGLEERLARRTHQWILRDGARREPLCLAPAGATGAPHALGRAS